MNIYQKLIEVRKEVPYLKKENDGHQYKYVGSSQVLASVRQKMDELGLILIPEVIGHKVTEDMVESKDKYGNPKHTTTYFTELDIRFTWVNAEKPEETITATWYGQGVDIAGEKGVGKALTYAEKYFLLKQFNIATDKDDPDAFQQQHTPQTQQAPQPLLATPTQRKVIANLYREIVITDAEFKEINTSFGIESKETMTKDQAQKLIETLATYPKKEVAANA